MNNNLYTPEKMIQIEYTKHTQNYDMGRFHYHNAYELLLLQEGEYTLITLDNACTLKKHDVSLITPYCMHKSLGRAGNERTLMYFDERYLNRYFTEKSRSLLLTCFQTGHLSLPQKHYEETLQLLFQIRSFSAKRILTAPTQPSSESFPCLPKPTARPQEQKKKRKKPAPPLLPSLSPISIKITVPSDPWMTLRIIFILQNTIYAAYSAPPPRAPLWTI